MQTKKDHKNCESPKWIENGIHSRPTFFRKQWRRATIYTLYFTTMYVIGLEEDAEFEGLYLCTAVKNLEFKKAHIPCLYY